jgi:hypothetical protein
MHEILQNDYRMISFFREFSDIFLVLRGNLSGRRFVCCAATVAALLEISSAA